jgi:hypothetical protein
VPEWRLRLSAAKLGGEITSTVSYAQLYNDQFRLAAGTAVYADGTPVLVDPVTGVPVTAGGTPLTLAMINDPAGVFYAAPHPDSGSITSPALRAALGASPIALTHGGPSATGVTGLPVAAMQYTWGRVGDGPVTVVRAGDKNTGLNELSFNFQSNYTFSSGPLQGFGIFTSVRAFARNRAYYTQVFPTAAAGSAVQADRVLHRLPGTTILDLNLSYRRNLRGGLEWTTQLNVNNVLDQSEVTVLPSPANAAQPRARLSTQPRQFIWTNTFRF